jgi:Asp-tRNA(Asn)/Glu-tRNA(Gln) amidotransferase A subunit family amidase
MKPGEKRGGELCALSATELAARIRRGELSAAEVVRAHVERAEATQAQLNAFVTLDAERALAAARRADEAQARGAALGPLHGLPLTVKSCIHVAGLRCEAGSRLRAGVVAQSDAPLVARLRAAGAIVLGTTNTPELLMAWETDNALHGRTNHPLDPARTPGGSSGGEAAAIAAGCSAGGVGSDGGGSIRGPAHFTGICGLKPTPGRIPATGHFPPSGGPFALTGVVGPMARAAGDVELLFRVMAGPDPGDVMSAPVPLREWTEAELQATRIGFFEDDGRTPATPETRAAVRRAAGALERAGFRVEPFRPAMLEAARQAWRVFFISMGARAVREFAGAREAELSPTLRDFLAIADREPPLTLERLAGAWFERDRVRAELAAAMEDFPVLLCPVCAIPAFRHGERAWQVEGVAVGYLHPERDIWSYTEWFNLAGNPAAVVPAGRSPEGLPIGVQIVGRPWEEERVLAVARMLEVAPGGELTK